MDIAKPGQDQQRIAALLNGDNDVFLTLVREYQPTMQRVCQVYLHDAAVAEEVLQDTWLDFLRGLKRFEGRSSLKTWLFSILTHKAKTRSKRESRSIPFSDLEGSEEDDPEPSVDPSRFLPAGHEWADHWAVMPRPWGRSAEEEILSGEVMEKIRSAILLLPQNQRAVFTLRDIEGWSSEEVCNVLNLTETNQRVVLHRARSRIRRALEIYYDGKVDQN